MNGHVTFNPSTSAADLSLAELLAQLEGHDDKVLILDYAGRRIQSGYHVTEVKAGAFVTLDCGGNPDAWQETVLQVEDIPAKEGLTYLQVGKFRKILAQVDRKVRLDNDARLTFEVSRPAEPMQVFDIARIAVEESAVVVDLAARPAICKPRHRVRQEASGASCCVPHDASACCG